MPDKRKYRLTIHETRAYDFIVEAASEDEVREIALSGELDFDVDSVRNTSLECDVASIVVEA